MMGLLDILTNAPATLFDEYNQEVILRPVMGESKSISSNISDNAVEDGTEITDHVLTKPPSFSVKTFFADKNDLAAAVVDAIFGGDKSVTDKITLLETWQLMGDILTYRGPIFSGFLTQGYDMYADSLVISGLEIARSTENGAGLDVTISLRKVVIAEALMAEINLPQAARSRRNGGAAATRSASATGGARSILTRMFN